MVKDFGDDCLKIQDHGDFVSIYPKTYAVSCSAHKDQADFGVGQVSNGKTQIGRLAADVHVTPPVTIGNGASSSESEGMNV